jgi:hypothetical protein
MNAKVEEMDAESRFLDFAQQEVQEQDGYGYGY